MTDPVVAGDPNVITQNGYQLQPPLRDYQIPATSHTVTLIALDDALILLYILGRWQSEIENIGLAGTDGFSVRPIGSLSGGSTSNHYSGTAVDILAASTYPGWTTPDSGDGAGVGQLYTAQSKAAKIAHIRTFFDAVTPCARWGMDYGDEQHIELTSEAHAGAAAAVVANIRAGLLPNTPPALMVAGAVGSTSGVGVGGDATQSNVGADLPAIATEPGITPLPIVKSSGVSAFNRLDDILVQGLKVSAQLAPRVLSCAMSYSTSQVGQLSMAVQDTPDARYFSSGMFDLGSSIDFANQHMDVRSVTLSARAGAPQLDISARSRVISMLRGPAQTGPGTWGQVDIEVWIHERGKEVGARVITQPLGSQTISRQASSTVETTWDVMVRLATLLGVWCYECDGTLVFAKPSYLVAVTGHTGWAIRWTSWSDYSENLNGMPVYTATYDASGVPTLTFGLIGPDNHLARPGDYVRYKGPGAAAGNWILTSVTVNVIAGAVVQCSADRIVDPTIAAVVTTV